MAKRQSKTRSINVFFHFVTLFPIIFLLILTVTLAVLTFFYARSDDPLYFYIMIGFGAFMMVYYAIYTIYVNRQFRRVFVKGLYQTTISNFESIARNESSFYEYPNKQYDEINALNSHVDVLRRELSGATLIPSTASNDYSNIALEYLNEEKHIITFEPSCHSNDFFQ